MSDKHLAVFDKNHCIVWQRNLILNNSIKSSLAYSLLFLYMSQINPLDPDDTQVWFTKESLKRITGKEIVNESIINAINEMQSAMIRIEDEFGQFMNIGLFERTGKKIKNGKEVYLLECTNSGKKYFFSGKDFGYHLHKLDMILKIIQACEKLKSGYRGYILSIYKYIHDHLVKKEHNEWVEEYDAFKRILGYSGSLEYKYFNQKYIKSAHIVLNTNSDVKFEYRKKGKVIEFIAVRESNAKIEKEAKRIEKIALDNMNNDMINLLKESLTVNGQELLKEQEINTIIKTAHKYHYNMSEIKDILIECLSRRDEIYDMGAYIVADIKREYTRDKMKKKKEKKMNVYITEMKNENQSGQRTELEEIQQLWLNQVPRNDNKNITE